MKAKEDITVVWFKRDLRLHDNESVYKALQCSERVLFIYVFENLLINDPHYSERHWNFIKQSLVDMNTVLEHYNTKVFCVTDDLFSALNKLQHHYTILNVFSHQETGLEVTFKRDKTFKRYCKNNLITWTETVNNGVRRGLLNRDNWFEKWEHYMYKPQLKFEACSSQFITDTEIEALEAYFQVTNLSTPKSKYFQKGGTTTGWKYANSFFKQRYKNYMFHISKPEASRNSCSRLSPYIAWGNLSVREVFQRAKQEKETSDNKRQLSGFISRLRWQAHFIQKFEMECTMENASVNKGYHKLKKSISKDYQHAWKNGVTGFPLVDAAMRCLNTTGYINFRMRAMLVSFFTHILWQPWQDATHHLSRNFLDFEPGIHFPQLQMQAGETGINNLRIYNPVKNGLEHDPEAIFIKKWVPELENLPVQFIHEPYLMTPLDQHFNTIILGKDYPYPIVDIKKHRKRASDILWNMKKNPTVKQESLRILKKHTITHRNRLLKDE